MQEAKRISIRAYARHRGVSDTSVRRAISAGRICLEPDGSIDVARADRAWEQNTNVSQRHEPSHTSRPSADEPGASSFVGGGPSLLQARTVNEVVKAQTNKVRLAKMKEELVDRARAEDLFFRFARMERDAWTNWPARIAAEMAARLGVDEHAMHSLLEAKVHQQLTELGQLCLEL